MPDMNEPYTTYEHGWILRIKQPANKASSRVLLLLHGWTGDESVMWIFTHHLPSDYWILSPRGPVPAPEKGYGWVSNHTTWPKLKDFEPVAQSLFDAVNLWRQDLHISHQAIDVMGFSQGAAMAYAFAVFYPQEIHKIVALAGFLPKDQDMPGQYNALTGKQIYVAHGTKDDTVPVDLAQQAVQTLKSAGADVLYCESDVGHKLSVGCLKGLNSFLE